MSLRTKKLLCIGALGLLILVPRLALLGNGLDAQRMWDTNTPAAFHLLDAVKNHHVGEFLKSDQKYPLLGSYLYVPVIGGYYTMGRLFHAFSGADDFVRQYVLGETNLFFWIRLEMLVLNLMALLLLYRLTKRYTNNSVYAGLYALGFAVVDFYVTMFSVEPRIHSFAFVGTVLVLSTSFALAKEKTLVRYLLAFGSVAVAASLSQSGFTTIVLPIIAHLYDVKRKRIQPMLNGFFVYGCLLFVGMTVLLGYPRLLAALWEPSIHFRDVFLSPEHTQPLLSGIRQGAQFFLQYFLYTIPAMLWALFVGFWFVCCAGRRRRITLEVYDWMAIAHIGVFFLLFGFSNVLTGRFTLAIVPSLCFLAARVVFVLQEKRAVVYPMRFLLAVQALAMVQLTLVGMHTDTRTQAARFLLTHSDRSDKILSTMNHELLGIVPAPESVSMGDSGPTGAVDILINTKELVGKKSRRFVYWDPKGGKISDTDITSALYVVVSSDHPDRYIAEDALHRNGFEAVKTFSALRIPDPRSKSFIPWDMIVPAPTLPLSFVLGRFRALGPTVVVYEQR